ncbi:MAG: type II secretion system GspH family protein [Phycisphaerales bacterium]|nr:type II secretion system GspH family protein [Phycisphaerales bacterium]
MRRTRGFSLIELLISLVLAALLMIAVMVALDMGFRAYRASAEQVSAGVQGRIIIERLQAMVRGGVDFGPLPSSPSETSIESDCLAIQMPEGDWVTLAWDATTSELTWTGTDGTHALLEGVTQALDSGGTLQPFRLDFHDGRWLMNATMDLVVEPELVTGLDLEGDQTPPLRFTGSARPRIAAWEGR